MSHLSSVRSLILNASYEPMRIVTWQKALLLWFQEKVEIIEYHEFTVHSAKLTFRLPSVMRLKEYVRPKRFQRVRFCRENVYLRDDFTCQYCSQELSMRELTLDHVLPLCRKGPTTWKNVVAACRKCNQKKGSRTPEQAQMPLLKKPDEPTWLPGKQWCFSDKVAARYPLAWLPYLDANTG